MHASATLLTGSFDRKNALTDMKLSLSSASVEASDASTSVPNGCCCAMSNSTDEVTADSLKPFCSHHAMTLNSLMQSLMRASSWRMCSSVTSEPTVLLNGTGTRG